MCPGGTPGTPAPPGAPGAGGRAGPAGRFCVRGALPAGGPLMASLAGRLLACLPPGALLGVVARAGPPPREAGSAPGCEAGHIGCEGPAPEHGWVLGGAEGGCEAAASIGIDAIPPLAAECTACSLCERICTLASSSCTYELCFREVDPLGMAPGSSAEACGRTCGERV